MGNFTIDDDPVLEQATSKNKKDGGRGMQRSTTAHRLLGKVLAPVIVALVLAFSLSYSGFDWYAQLTHWLRPAPPSFHKPEVHKNGPVGPPITVTPMRPRGNDSSVSATATPLVLVRTQVGRNSREGFAQLGVDATSPQTYAAGALLANGTRITEIYPHYVVLERDGQVTQLYLQGEAQVSAAPPGLFTVGGEAPSSPTPSKSKDRLSPYLRPSPVFVGNRLRGYALYPNRDPQPFSKLGLQAGDLLTEINGAPLAGPREAIAELNTLANGASLAVVIERQGVPQALLLDGAILKQAIEAALDPNVPKPSYSDLKEAFKVNSPPLTGKH